MATAPLTEHQSRVASLDPAECSKLIDDFIEQEVPLADVREAIDLILTRCEYDTKFFGQCIMIESYDDPMSAQHDESWELWDDEREPLVGICAWRTFGKSLGSKTKAVKSILYRQQPFIVVIGKTFDYASGETEAIKQELLQNERIQYIWGKMQARSYDGLDTKFSEKAWFASDPATGRPVAFICPKGARQQVRGLNVRINGRAQRPTLIIIDDLEDDKYLNSEEYRAEVWDWLNGAVRNCVNMRRLPNSTTGLWDKEDNAEWRPPWRIFYQDTYKHQDSAMAHILESTEWTTRRYSKAVHIIDKDGKSVWTSAVPEIISDRQIQAEVAAAEREGQMDRFAMESMCLPVSPDYASWTKEMFQYYPEQLMPIQNSPDFDRFVIVDPAKTSTQRSAFTAILAVAANIKTGKIYFRKQIVARLEPEQIIDQSIDLALAMNSKMLAVEVTGLEDIITHQYQNEITRRGIRDLRFLKLKSRSKPDGDYGTGREAIKRARSGFIIPYYRKGYVYHEYSLKGGPLEQQELSYPKPARWDALDCAGYVPQVLQMLGRYFAFVETEGQDRDAFPDADDWHDDATDIRSRRWALN